MPTRYPGAQIAAVGCGSGGSVLGLRGGRLVSVDAMAPLGVHNTSSAGDSLFAGWRSGHREPTSVLLTGPELAALRLRHPVRVSLGWWDLAG